MVDKLQESLQFYKELSKTEEQSSPQRTGDSEKAKESSKEKNHKEDHLTQVYSYVPIKVIIINKNIPLIS